MTKKLYTIFPMLLVLLILSCNIFKSNTLLVYNFDDYISPEVVAKFEKQFKCKVQIDTFGSQDELSTTLLKQEKAYDLIFSSSYTMRQLFENRLLKDIDHTKLPNLKNLDIEFIKKTADSGMSYSIPYSISFTGIAYNKNKVRNFVPSWTMFGRPELAGKIAFLNDEREVIGAASKSIGYSYNGSDDLQLRRAANIVLNWKKNGAEFKDNRDLEPALLSGQYDLIQSYSGDILTLMKEHPEIGFALPEEGVAINLDSFAIPSSCSNTKLAYLFINFFLDAENAKENVIYLSYMAPNTAAKTILPKEIVDNKVINPSNEFMTKSEHIVSIGDDGNKYTQLWNTIKSAE